MPDRTPFQPEALLRRLAEGGVDYVVVGGIAMVAHGSSRSTFDLDICYAADRANLEALGTVLTDLGAKLRGIPEDVPFVPDATAIRRTVILTLTTSSGDIDLLVEPAGAPRYSVLRDRARVANFDGLIVRIASLDDLESMKRAAGRPKDLVDLEEITEIRRLDATEREGEPEGPERQNG